MGFGLPSGIGAKFAKPEKEVWVTVGDGGFQMTQAELSTIAQEGIKINIAILNNGYLGMVRKWQEFFYDKRYSATPMKGPDFLKIAEAHGLKAFRVTRRDEVEDAIQEARKSPGAVLIEFKVEKEDSVYPMVPSGAAIDAMIRRPMPENMMKES
jgi:acetolactate synthase-1/2/3 large subunit